MFKRLLAPTLLLLAFLSPDRVRAHGINGHVWVSDGAIDQLKDCTLAGWLDSPKYRPYTQIGASFPDSGYSFSAGRSYGETAHWEPFIQAYIDYMRKKYKDNYDSEEARMRVAFLMGDAGHGAEDEIFDTVFLRKSYQEEGTDQDILDAGTDFMLIAEEHTKLRPKVYFPDQDLIKIFATPGIDVEVTSGMMAQGMLTVNVAVIGLVSEHPQELDDDVRDDMPWTSQHYVDAREPGSLEFEKKNMAPYYDAIWHRLHGDFRKEDVIIYGVPEPGAALASTDHTNVDSHVTLFFGYGVQDRTLTQDTVHLFDAAGVEVPIDIGFTRWDGGGTSQGRLVQLKPKVNLTPNAVYTAKLTPGIELIDGTKTKDTYTYKVPTSCASGACDAPPALPTCKAIPDKGLAFDEDPMPKGETGGCQSVPVADILLIVLIAIALPIIRKDRAHKA